mmetsp:Transcript_24570/g.36844  ORF Transcript_24570/g.36844 Transcript_24570/m.36844 type:complete len:272 (+) Transcript_24570:52-867(+)
MDAIDLKEKQDREAKNKQKFQDLLGLSVDEQAEFFLKSFIFELGDDWKDVNKLAAAYKKAMKDAGESKDMNHIEAGKFLQVNGKTRTGLERKRECKDIDINNDGRICFIEYLLLHYKAMILKAFYKRHKTEPEEDLSKEAVGVIGVGHKLVEELVTIPLNLDPELVKSLEDLSLAKKNRLKKIAKMEKKAAKGGVFGKRAQLELDEFLAKGDLKTTQIELKLEAWKKKNLKKAKTAMKKLAAEKKKEEEAKKAAAKAKRKAFANRAAAFEN